MKILNATYDRTLVSVNADGSPALNAGEPTYTVRLVRCRAPRAIRLHRLRRWRWGVTPDPRTCSQHAAYGYTFTRHGALRAIADRIARGGQ